MNGHFSTLIEVMIDLTKSYLRPSPKVTSAAAPLHSYTLTTDIGGLQCPPPIPPHPALLHPYRHWACFATPTTQVQHAAPHFLYR